MALTNPTITFPNGGEIIDGLTTIKWTDSPILDTVYDLLNSKEVRSQPINSNKRAFAQSFITDSNGATHLKTTLMVYSVNTAGTVNANIYSDNNNQPGNLLYQGSTDITNGSTSFTVDVDCNLSPNTIYWMVYEVLSGSAYYIISLTSDSYPNSTSGYRTLSWSIPYFTYNAMSNIILSTPNTSQYEIQLSIDDGNNWNNIVALTNPNILTYDYDFTNEPASTNALIRVRSYDGTNYSDWDQSDTPFTISHGPTTPPTVTIISIDHYKISDETGINQSHIKFTFDQDVTQWTVNVLGVDETTGTVADSGGAVNANTEITAIIDWNELYQEGDNKVNIYGCNISGLWTPYES